MKKRFFIVLALMLLPALLLSGCAAPNPIEGKWEMQTPYAALLESGSEAVELGNLEGYVDLSGLCLRSVYTFEGNGTYTYKADVEQFIRDCEAAWVAGVDAYYEAQIREKNLDITVQQAWTLDGITRDDLVDESIIRKALADVNRHGNYRAKEGRLYLSAGTEYRVDETVYTEYEISGDTLTFLSATVGEPPEGFPVTLTRVS